MLVRKFQAKAHHDTLENKFQRTLAILLDAIATTNIPCETCVARDMVTSDCDAGTCGG